MNISDEFTFTDWLFNEFYSEFYYSTKDIFNHDRCSNCEVWIKPLCEHENIDPKYSDDLIIKCPNCGHKEIFS